MPRYVALFRGINVGKARRIAMADLRALLGELGYEDVRTLLNSGNAVFTGKAAPAVRHAGRIRAAVARELGVDAYVIVKSAKDIAAIVAGNALAGIAADPAKLLVAMTGDAKALAALAPLAGRPWGAERLHVGRHAAYLWCAHGILESKAAEALLGALAENATTRNWATLGKILVAMRAKDSS
jgi:uncharacterized protein (DUF1697 family)